MVNARNRRLELNLIIDVREKWNQNYSTAFTENIESYNEKLISPDTNNRKLGTVKNIVCEISGLDL